MTKANFAILAGDGTGPEIIAEVVKVLGRCETGLPGRGDHPAWGPCRRCATRPAGYKIALTSQAMRKLVGYGDSISGRLSADQVGPSGSTLAHARRGRLAVEFRVAFRFGEALPPQVAAGDAGRAALLPYLAADNAWNAGLVLGPAAVDWKQVDLGAVHCEVR